MKQPLTANFSINEPRTRSLLIILFLAIVTMIVYGRLIGYDFVNFDDPAYVLQNRHIKNGFTIESIWWAFSFSDKLGSYWHPLTWLSLMLDYHFFGLNPSGYHLVNVLFHLVNSILLFLLIQRATEKTWAGAFVAVVFALHPMNVESVAWIVERKTVLSGFFCLLALRCYIEYVKRPGRLTYLAVPFFFALGLMAKANLVMFPFMLLLIDYWPLGRSFRFKIETPWTKADEGRSSRMSRISPLGFLIIEKVPLFALSVLSVSVTLMSVRNKFQSDEQRIVTLFEKILNAIYAYAAYIEKLLFPSDLSVYYPMPSAFPIWQVLVAALVLALITFIACMQAGKRRWLFVGWLWYLLMLLPASGLVRDGLWPAMADRFVYLAYIGLFVIATWGIEEISVGMRHRKTALCVGSFIIIAALMFFTIRQATYWKDSGSLFSRALAVTGENDIAYANLGYYYFSKHDYRNAFDLFLKAAVIDPLKVDYEYANGALAYNQKDYTKAIPWFMKALKKNENHMGSLFFMGIASEKIGDEKNAIYCFDRILESNSPDMNNYKQKVSLRLRYFLWPKVKGELDSLRKTVLSRPYDRDAKLELAETLYRYGILDEALTIYKELEKSGYRNWLMFYHVGEIFRRQGKVDQALAYYGKSRASCEKESGGFYSLGKAYKKMRRYRQAIGAFSEGIDRDADRADAAYNLAICYYNLGDRKTAKKYFIYVEQAFPDMAWKVVPYRKKLCL